MCGIPGAGKRREVRCQSRDGGSSPVRRPTDRIRQFRHKAVMGWVIDFEATDSRRGVHESGEGRSGNAQQLDRVR